MPDVRKTTFRPTRHEVARLPMNPEAAPMAATQDRGRPRVAIADAHPFVLEALTAAVREGGYEVSGAFTSVAALLGAVDQRPPELVLIDLNEMPRDGLGAVARIRARRPEVKIVLLIAPTERSLMAAAVDAGADGVVCKTSSREQIVAALGQVLGGHVILPAGWRSMRAAAPAPRPASPLAELSARQLEVLEMVAAGAANEEIAVRLFITVNTVKFHLRSIYSRLGIHNRVQAARLLADSDVSLEPLELPATSAVSVGSATAA